MGILPEALVCPSPAPPGPGFPEDTAPESSWRSQIMSTAGQCGRASPEKRDRPSAILVGTRQGDQSKFPAGNPHGRHSYGQATLSSPESGEEGPPKANWPQRLALLTDYVPYEPMFWRPQPLCPPTYSTAALTLPHPPHPHPDGFLGNQPSPGKAMAISL